MTAHARPDDHTPPPANPRLTARHSLAVVAPGPAGPTPVRSPRPSRARYLPHSHLYPPRQPNPATGRMWPPRGWTPEGLTGFRVHTERVRLFLLTWGCAQHSPAYAARIDVAAARVRELAQFGPTPDDAAAALREATTALLDLRGYGDRADTRPLTLPRPPLPRDVRTDVRTDR